MRHQTKCWMKTFAFRFQIFKSLLAKLSKLINGESWDNSHMSQLEKIYVRNGLKHSIKQFKYCTLSDMRPNLGRLGGSLADWDNVPTFTVYWF